LNPLTRPARFDAILLPHLDAAHNLARWLLGNRQDAEDTVQESYLRAFRFFGGFHGETPRGWLLKIVRNTCYTWLRQSRSQQLTEEFDEEFFGADPRVLNPEENLLQNETGRVVRRALETVPSTLRETLVLRELEGMSYREISEVTGSPIGTVMSRLSRGRDSLRDSLNRLSNRAALRHKSKTAA